MRIAREHGARYLGDEISEGDWAARHDRYATPLHGRTKDGQVVPMSWHCEDAAINYTRTAGGERGSGTRSWPSCGERTDVFDDWGMFAYTSGGTGADYLTEIDVGIWEQRLDDRDVAAVGGGQARHRRGVAIEHGGSISACHGSCREGEVDLVPDELGRGFDVMLDVKRALDPNNIMNPGKYRLDRAYDPRRGGPGTKGYRYADEHDATPEPTAGHRVAITRSSTSSRSTPADDRARAPADVPQLGHVAHHEQPPRPPGLDAPALRRHGHPGSDLPSSTDPTSSARRRPNRR